MGTIQTLRPNGIVYGGGAYNNVGGAGVLAAASDASDATYIRKTSSGQQTIMFDLGTYTLTGTQRVKRTRIGGRYQKESSPAVKMFVAGSCGNPMSYSPSGLSPSSWATKYTSWSDVIEPTQTNINGAYIYLIDSNDSPGRCYVADVWMELDVVTQPTVSVSAVPTGSAKPVVSWTFTDTDLDPESAWQVKVFDSATYSGGGFSPDTSTPVWDSGVRYGTDLSVQVATLLNNGTAYRAYVRAGKDAGYAIGTYWSAWTYAAWTASYTVPTVPSLSLSWSTPNGRVTATATGAALTGGLTSQTFELQASADGGTTWVQVRSATALVPNGSYVATAYDYEATRAVTMKYRVRAAALDATGVAVASAWSSVGSLVTVNDEQWWFKPISNLTASMGGVAVLEAPEVSIDETLAVHYPLGGSAAVVVSGDEYGEDGTFIVDCRDTEIATFRVIARHQGAILVQDPFLGHRYIRWTGRSRTILGTVAAPRTRWAMTYVEVAKPAVT